MAYDFNGSNQWMTTASSPVASLPITMACWFNSDSLATGQVLIHLVNTAFNNHYFGIALRGDVAGDPVQVGAFSGVSFQGANTTTGYSANTWQHACGVILSATSRTVYLNGTNSATSTGSVSLTPNQVRIGRFVNTSGNDSFYLDGRLADVGIWSAELTTAEIGSLAKGVSCDQIRPQSLVFYAPLIRDIVDVRGGMTITNTNTATVSDHPRVYA